MEKILSVRSNAHKIEPFLGLSRAFLDPSALLGKRARGAAAPLFSASLMKQHKQWPTSSSAHCSFVEGGSIISLVKFDHCVTVLLGFLLSITPECLSRESVYVLVNCVCLHVFMGGGGGCRTQSVT